jgi:RNA polymerase sigma-70 factor, ECF subfamily
VAPVDVFSIERLRTQDHAAFEALSERHYVPIRRYLTRLSGDPEVAAELTQETFLRAYQALPRLADDSDVQGWLYRIATNLARQHYRHGRLIHWRALEPFHALTAPIEEDVARQDLVRRALAELSLDQRACLLLYAWTGYTCAEIGTLMDRTPEAVRMLLVRARRRFRALYEGLERGEDPPLLHTGGAPRNPLNGRPTPATLCAARDETLPLYARGDLQRVTFKEITKHLADCHECRAALHAEQALNRLVQRSLARAFESPFATVPAAWHASHVLVKRRPHTQEEERDGSTQVVGVQVRRQVSQVRAQVEREVRQDGHEVGR